MLWYEAFLPEQSPSYGETFYRMSLVLMNFVGKIEMYALGLVMLQ
jgi:hypothetical protein